MIQKQFSEKKKVFPPQWSVVKQGKIEVATSNLLVKCVMLCNVLMKKSKHYTILDSWPRNYRI